MFVEFSKKALEEITGQTIDTGSSSLRQNKLKQKIF